MDQLTASPIFQLLSKPGFRVPRHLLFWLLYFSEELLGFVGVTEPFGRPWWQVMLPNIPLMIAVYANLYVLLPRFLLRGKIRPYVFSVVTMAVATVFLMIGMTRILPECIECYLEDFDPLSYGIFNFLETGFLVGTTTGLNLFIHWVKDREKISELEQANLKTELEYLKNQVNPHFLFNSLNNIYVLSQVNPKVASETILQLSDLLRYQIYDCAKERVPLVKEVEYLKNLLSLDQIRKENAEVEFEVEGNASGIMIPPFLFLPFVENAVKHGGAGKGGSFIKVKFNLQKGHINFKIENTKGFAPPEFEVGGMGLKNIYRRLELLYPEKHTLKIQEKGTYLVELDLFL